MPPVKGKARSRKPAAKKKGRGRKAPTSFFGRMRMALAEFGTGVLSFMAVGLAAVALIAVMMLFAGGYFSNMGTRVETLTGRAAKAMGFSVTRVTMLGSEHLTSRDILGAFDDEDAGGVLGRSLMHVDIHEARGRIEGFGWVEAAAVERLWPNTLHVSVVERRPAALWQDRTGSYRLVDGAGAIIDEAAPTGYTDLPVIAGTQDPVAATPLLEALSERPQLLSRVAVIMSVGDRRFDLRFRNDFTARLPEEATGAALDRLEGLGAGTGKLAETLDYIDLRDPEWAYLKPKAE